MSKKKLAIIIPIYNRLKITIQGIKDLFEKLHDYQKNLTFFDIQVIIVDDGSTDGSSDWIKSNYEDIHLLMGDGNLWWSGAINKGAKYAIEKIDSEYILLWLDDIMADDQYFDFLEREVKKYPLCIIGSHIKDYKSKKTWAKMMCFNKLTGISKYCSDKHDCSAVYKYLHYKWFAGMGTLIPKNVILDVGYWDAINFPHYFGDTQFCIDAYKKGYKFKMCDELKVYNKTEYSSFQAKDWISFMEALRYDNVKSRYNMRKRFIFYKSNCIGYLWIFTYVFYYIRYLKDFFVKKQLK